MEEKKNFRILRKLAEDKGKSIYALAVSLEKQTNTEAEFEDYLNNFKKMSVLDYFRLCYFLGFDDIRMLANLLSEQQWTQQQLYF